MTNEKLEELEEEAVSTPEEPILLDDEKNDVQDVPEVKVEKEVDKPRGYQSYDDWIKSGKDPDEFKGKKAYEKEGERYEALIKTQREVKELRDLTAKMWEQNQKIEEASYKKAREELKLQSMQATRIGDVETVNSITDKLVELEQFKPKAVETPAVPGKPEVARCVQNFIDDNPYYLKPKTEEDHIKKAFIDFQDQNLTNEYSRKGITLTVEQHMAELTKRVEDKFSPTKERTVIVQQSGDDVGKSPTEARSLMNSLNSDNQKIVRALQQMGKMKTTQQLKEYVKRAALTGGLK